MAKITIEVPAELTKDEVVKQVVKQNVELEKKLQEAKTGLERQRSEIKALRTLLEGYKGVPHPGLVQEQLQRLANLEEALKSLNNTFEIGGYCSEEHV
jgi:predicted translin family RNA/ssDNA-binding protein